MREDELGKEGWKGRRGGRRRIVELLSPRKKVELIVLSFVAGLNLQIQLKPIALFPLVPTPTPTTTEAVEEGIRERAARSQVEGRRVRMSRWTTRARRRDPRIIRSGCREEKRSEGMRHKEEGD